MSYKINFIDFRKKRKLKASKIILLINLFSLIIIISIFVYKNSFASYKILNLKNAHIELNKKNLILKKNLIEQNKIYKTLEKDNLKYKAFFKKNSEKQNFNIYINKLLQIMQKSILSDIKIDKIIKNNNLEIFAKSKNYQSIYKFIKNLKSNIQNNDIKLSKINNLNNGYFEFKLNIY